MSDIFEQMTSAFDRLRTKQPALPMAAQVPNAQCVPTTDVGYRILRDEMYFTVRVHELVLAKGREWWKDYDPLVLVATEFLYGTERISVPYVIGPNLIKRMSAPAKFGVILHDTRAAGPYPYRGGDVDISVSLYAVERQDHAVRLLHFVDSVAGAVGGSGDMAVMSKVGSALIEGIESLLGLEQTVFRTGHKFSTGSHPVQGFRAGYFVLFAPPVPSLLGLRVENGRLTATDANGNPDPYRQSDYVLYSITGNNSRGDESGLPFPSMLRQAERAAWSEGAKGWQRAKATLQTWFEQMLESPDVTRAEAWRLLDVHLKGLEVLRERAGKIRALANEKERGTAGRLQEDLDKAASLIQL